MNRQNSRHRLPSEALQFPKLNMQYPVEANASTCKEYGSKPLIDMSYQSNGKCFGAQIASQERTHQKCMNIGLSTQRSHSHSKKTWGRHSCYAGCLAPWLCPLSEALNRVCGSSKPVPINSCAGCASWNGHFQSSGFLTTGFSFKAAPLNFNFRIKTNTMFYFPLKWHLLAYILRTMNAIYAYYVHKTEPKT